MSEPVRVLYLVGGLRVGGMETHLLHLVRRLDPKRFRPEICCFDASDAYRRRIDEIGVPRHDLDIPRLNSVRTVLRLRRLLAVIVRMRPDVVHTYGYTCDVLGPLAARLRPGASIVTTRRGEDTVARHQAMRSRVNRFTDRIVCVSEATKRFTERTERVGPARLVVIPNGVLVPRPRDRREGSTIRFGTLGTVKEIKGTDLLVEAFLSLGFRDAEPSGCELRIGGRTDRSPEWAAALVSRAESAGGRISFLGHQSDAARFYEGLDVFVLPSRSEGMSNALLEAMAHGLPCVATDVGSNRDVLQNAASGLSGGIVTDASAAALTDAMATLAGDRTAREAMGRSAREIAERYHSMEVMVRAHETLYEELRA